MKNPIIESFAYLSATKAFTDAQIELATKANQMAKVTTLQMQKATTQEAIDALVSDALEDVREARLEDIPVGVSLTHKR